MIPRPHTPHARPGAARNLREEVRPRPRRGVACFDTRPAPSSPLQVLGDLQERARPGAPSSVRCQALSRLAECDWPVRRRRGLLMHLLHAALDPAPPVRFAALDALARVAMRYPRLRPDAAALLERWSRAACRATALHAARLLDAPPFAEPPGPDGA